MFEVSREYPTAVTAGPGGGDESLLKAVAWLLRQPRRPSEQILIYAPTVRNLKDNDVFVQLLKRREFVGSTWKGSISGWSGGPVLAAWPDRVKLAEIADDNRTTSLCVVPWADGEIDAWVSATRPEPLEDGAPTAVGPDLDPVIIQGLKTLTRMVNHANNLAGALDKRDAVAVLRTLKRAGYELPAEEIYAWALGNGWPARGAERLREMTDSFRTGRGPNMRGDSPLRSDILQIWRDEAAQ